MAALSPQKLKLSCKIGEINQKLQISEKKRAHQAEMLVHALFWRKDLFDLKRNKWKQNFD